MSEFFPEDHLAEIRRRGRLRRALRIKQFVSILTTAGYGLVAGGAWEPLLKHQQFGAAQMLAFSGGLVMLGLSIYFAPEGEVQDVGR